MELSKNISEPLIWLGILASSLSAVRALNSWFEFGFQGVWKDILDYYSQITHPFRVLVFNIFSEYSVPNWLPDMMILYLVLFIAGYRASVLPLVEQRYLSVHNTARIETRKFPDDLPDDMDINEKVPMWASQYGFDPQNVRSWTSKDGYVEAEIKIVRPTWLVYLRRTVRCLTLLPVLTLEPYRSMSHSPLTTLRLLKMKEPNEFFVKDRGSYYTVHWLEFNLAQFHRALQIIALPVLVAVFLFLGTYLS